MTEKASYNNSSTIYGIICNNYKHNFIYKKNIQLVDNYQTMLKNRRVFVFTSPFFVNDVATKIVTYSGNEDCLLIYYFISFLITIIFVIFMLNIVVWNL